MKQRINQEGCFADDEFINMLLHPVMLEVSLRNIWCSDKDSLPVSSSTLCNRNLRYSAYRSIFFFLFRRNERKKNYRTALPSCLVDEVRRRYPEDSVNKYVGFAKK
eukprot:GFUD01112109.1.p1 GENE.GFUD01112109.1~~GFUD01112109.1.p1  ORF type:complete len:106 (-),score=29.66 GFUD01112109.1:18-335(-)